MGIRQIRKSHYQWLRVVDIASIYIARLMIVHPSRVLNLLYDCKKYWPVSRNRREPWWGANGVFQPNKRSPSDDLRAPREMFMVTYSRNTSQFRRYDDSQTDCLRKMNRTYTGIESITRSVHTTEITRLNEFGRNGAYSRIVRAIPHFSIRLISNCCRANIFIFRQPPWCSLFLTD